MNKLKLVLLLHLLPFQMPINYYNNNILYYINMIYFIVTTSMFICLKIILIDEKIDKTPQEYIYDIDGDNL
jgi:tellurite resistance protein TehA-like permease